VISKRFGEYIDDEFFDVLIKIFRIKKKYSLSKLSSKKNHEYLFLRSWLKLKFKTENFYWNFYSNEKSSNLPFNFQINFAEQIEQEQFENIFDLYQFFSNSKEWNVLLKISRSLKSK